MKQRPTTFRIKSCIATKNDHAVVDIFGYSSKGLPGLEIKGIGNLSTVIKEKLIYLTRLHSYKIPLKRFVLCVEIDLRKIDKEELLNLELPLLILFWSMADILKIYKLEECLSAGKINVSGEILGKKIPLNLCADSIVIASREQRHKRQINLEDLFASGQKLFIK